MHCIDYSYNIISSILTYGVYSQILAIFLAEMSANIVKLYENIASHIFSIMNLKLA